MASFIKRVLLTMANSMNNMTSKGVKKRPFTVLIEGNIGSGKTTFLNHFKKFDGICLLTEPVEEWRNLNGYNLLDLMYKDPEKWSMPFQSYVSLTMVNMHTTETSEPIKLMERSLYSARYIFVENMKRNGIMHPAMFSVLQEWYDYIDKNVDLPVDLIVYLRSSPEVVLRRMQQRARSEEQCVPIEYLKQLHDLHEEWLYYKTSFVTPAPVLVLNADLEMNQIIEEYKKSEVSILQSHRSGVSTPTSQGVLTSPTKRTGRNLV